MGWIQGAAAIGGTIASMVGQNRANKENINLNRENRHWQETMSNTAHQRQAKDLEAAGLNRILGVSKSGATSPTNPAPTVQSTTDAFKNTALQMAQIESLNAQASKTRAETDILKPKAAIYGEIGDLISEGITKIKGAIGSFDPETFTPEERKKLPSPEAVNKGYKAMQAKTGLTSDEIVKMVANKYKNQNLSSKELYRKSIILIAGYGLGKDNSIKIKGN